MAPPTTKQTRSGVKDHITKKINQFKTCESYSIKIQDELNTADAPQEEYEAEVEFCRDVEQEVYAARTILKTKHMEWEIIRSDEEMEKALNLKKQEMEKAAEIEKQRDEERDKRIQKMFQQQQQDNTAATQRIIAAMSAAATPTVTVNAPKESHNQRDSHKDKFATLKAISWNEHHFGSLSMQQSIPPASRQYKNLII
ncbi:hypothetical protein DAPPUDRAFT_330926 [Daphnia pulex]|uniref:Uncharacterized protein n=1 Tax=Daphnia pulex TaxID=6669 RepID=E9HL10_DAPPU|nr:hypothetical protein DAPPUDRAFT_330926 [Daphnia pulex]|eukprot:EFX67577.1 hypothetical protein DAPPUDRAFT_330926 [Daphnia pulex]